MTDVIDPGMGSLKDFVERMVKEHGGWRPTAEAIGVDYQDLQRWARDGKNLQGFLDKLEKVRKEKKISKAAFWDGLVRAKRS
jgi:hypothetical protein